PTRPRPPDGPRACVAAVARRSSRGRRHGCGGSGVPVSSETTRETRKIDLGTHAVRVHESGAGPRTLFCLHDFLEEPDGWSPLAERLAGGTRVVALQQRGHGFSTAPPGSYTLGDLAADVLKVLDALAVERATLVGQGFGATVALAAALEA